MNVGDNYNRPKVLYLCSVWARMQKDWDDHRDFDKQIDSYTKKLPVVQ